MADSDHVLKLLIQLGVVGQDQVEALQKTLAETVGVTEELTAKTKAGDDATAETVQNYRALMPLFEDLAGRMPESAAAPATIAPRSFLSGSEHDPDPFNSRVNRDNELVPGDLEADSANLPSQLFERLNTHAGAANEKLGELASRAGDTFDQQVRLIQLLLDRHETMRQVLAAFEQRIALLETRGSLPTGL
jgi:hypothetical protein